MGYNKQILTNQVLNVDSISHVSQVGQTGLIGITYAVEAVFTGATCEFTAKLQVSSALALPASDDASWSDLENSSQSVTEAGNFTWNVSRVGYVWVQLVITDDSSGDNDGHVNANINVNP